MENGENIVRMKLELVGQPTTNVPSDHGIHDPFGQRDRQCEQRDPNHLYDGGMTLGQCAFYIKAMPRLSHTARAAVTKLTKSHNLVRSGGKDLSSHCQSLELILVFHKPPDELTEHMR